MNANRFDLSDEIALRHRHVIVMGVCASGKTTIGKALAQKAGLPFIDGDAFHPASNIAKMEAGTPLSDEDRWPWLARIGDGLAATNGLVIACSALKRSYRQLIREKAGRSAAFIHLSGSHAVLSQRMSNRTGHFMPTTLLDSQLATLEAPQVGEVSVTIDIDADIEEITNAAFNFIAVERSVA